MTGTDAGALLVDTLAIGRDLVAFVGAGGKSTLLRAVAGTLAGRGLRVVTTTTTKMGRDQVADLPSFWAAGGDDRKVVGPPPEAIDERWRTGTADAIVVEADGARHRLVKAPAPYEPVIPSCSTLVVAVMAADALGRPIADVAHRPERVAVVVGCDETDVLTLDRAVRLATSPDGMQARLPAAARFAVAVTRVGSRERVAAGALVAALGRAGVTVVLVPR
jgi:molybdenum cofactor cytidylyltransferase